MTQIREERMELADGAQKREAGQGMATKADNREIRAPNNPTLRVQPREPVTTTQLHKYTKVSSFLLMAVFLFPSQFIPYSQVQFPSNRKVYKGKNP